MKKAERRKEAEKGGKGGFGYAISLLANCNFVIISPQSCNQCEFSSSQTGDLRRHLKVHSGEKSNKCNQCEFSSSQTGDLRRHLKVHSGEKSNKCNQCDYASSRAGHLRRHLKVHSGEKPNKCNQCEFASSQAKGLPVAKRNRYFFNAHNF